MSLETGTRLSKRFEPEAFARNRSTLISIYCKPLLISVYCQPLASACNGGTYIAVSHQTGAIF